MIEFNIVYAKATTSVVTEDGAQQLVRHGSHWFADDPVVQANPSLFSSDPRFGLTWSGQTPAVMAEPPVEQATAEPGERRQTRRLPNPMAGTETRPARG